MEVEIEELSNDDLREERRLPGWNLPGLPG